MFLPKTASLLPASVVFLTLFGVSGAARADLTVVSQTTTTGYPAVFNKAGDDPNKSVVTITYYKNNSLRTETGSTVTIFDNTTGTSYTLNTDTKTYLMTKGYLGAFLKSAGPSLSEMKIDNKTVVEAGGQTRIIAGQKAKNYRFLAVFKMKWPTDVAEAKTPSAASDTKVTQLDRTLPVTLTVEGEDWATEGLHTGLEGSAGVRREFDSLPYLFPMSGAALEESIEKLDTIKGFTLNSTTSVTFSFPAWAAAEVGDLFKDPIVTTTETKVVSKNALDKALFAPPSDYRKVDAPLAPLAAK